ncbi:MAG: hypothetical protein K0S33_817 [Bacteroidetes bacterium]|jgi:hypothetical protein|nr:hypothetical protein [Bacteroidota bacterium]
MKKRLAPVEVYRKRVLKNAFISLIFILFSLLIGVAGYMYFYKLGLVDALLNASMILTGMGPIDAAPTDSAKIFASVYAIYSGVAFLTSVALLFSPVFHRFLHRFHLDIED